MDPQSAIGLLNLGQCLQLQGRPEEALAAFRRAQSADPALASARESAALLLYEQGRCEEAGKDLELVTRLSPPGSPAARRASTLLSILQERASLTDFLWKSSRELLRGDLRFAQGDREEGVDRHA